MRAQQVPGFSDSLLVGHVAAVLRRRLIAPHGELRDTGPAGAPERGSRSAAGTFGVGRTGGRGVLHVVRGTAGVGAALQVFRHDLDVGIAAQ